MTKDEYVIATLNRLMGLRWLTSGPVSQEKAFARVEALCLAAAPIYMGSRCDIEWHPELAEMLAHAAVDAMYHKLREYLDGRTEPTVDET